MASSSKKATVLEDEGGACLRNGHCRSGFCRQGLCTSPRKEHDPCSDTHENCPSRLVCSPFSRTCVSPHHVTMEPCNGVSDCAWDERCRQGRCVAVHKIGERCESVLPDPCETGSKCIRLDAQTGSKHCYALCSEQVSCPDTFMCVQPPSSLRRVCVPRRQFQFTTPPPLQTETRRSPSTGDMQVAAFILLFLVVMLVAIWGWVRMTRTRRDPALKKKRLRLNYEGNGLASITVVPSQPQSPPPVPAVHLFPVMAGGNVSSTLPQQPSYMNLPPPPYEPPTH